MLLYSTILNINKTMARDDFIRLVIDWNQNSPHEDNIIKGLEWNGERNVRFGNEKLWLEIIEYCNKNIIAVRFEKITEDGVIWDTDYIMNFADMRLAIRLDRSYNGEAVVTNAGFSTPYFITYLIEGGYLCLDVDLDVDNKALEITSDNITILENVIMSKQKYQLPVVYISKTSNNRNPIDVYKLCKRLKGSAHILLQQDKSSNNDIRISCNGMNEYNGAIGIYYPNDILGHKICLYKEGKDKQLLERVAGFVLQYGVIQRIDKLYTWQGVSNSLLMDRLESQRLERIEAEHAREKAENEKKEAENEIQDVYATFDEEFAELKRRIEELTYANESKEYENQQLRFKLAQLDEKPIIVQGEEEELYPNEIKDVVLEVIDDTLKTVETDTRRQHILKDILISNNYEHIGRDKRIEIKNILSNYKNMTKQIQSSLEKFGFELSLDGKHYKMQYKNDPRYLFTVSKTGSDGRGGKNLASEICRKIL